MESMMKIHAVTAPRGPVAKLSQEAISVDTYTASEIAAQEIPKPGLTEHELGQIYIAVQHNISVIRGMGVHTDKERQAMADAVREFYNLLREDIRQKIAQQRR